MKVYSISRPRYKSGHIGTMVRKSKDISFASFEMRGKELIMFSEEYKKQFVFSEQEVKLIKRALGVE